MTSHDNAVEICNRIQIEPGEILATRIAVKRTVEIRARVGDHLDLADVKLRSRRVASFGIFTTEIVADHRRGQTFVRDHSVLDGVRHINQLELRDIINSVLCTST